VQELLGEFGVKGKETGVPYGDYIIFQDEKTGEIQRKPKPGQGAGRGVVGRPSLKVVQRIRVPKVNAKPKGQMTPTAEEQKLNAEVTSAMKKVSKYIVLIKERLYDLNSQVHVMYDQAIAQAKTRSNNQPIMNKPINSSILVGPQRSPSRPLNFTPPSNANGMIPLSPSINYVPMLTTLPVTSMQTVSPTIRAYLYDSTNSSNVIKAQTSPYLPTSQPTTTNFSSYSSSNSSATYTKNTTKNQNLTAVTTTPASYFVDWAHRFNPWG